MNPFANTSVGSGLLNLTGFSITGLAASCIESAIQFFSTQPDKNQQQASPESVPSTESKYIEIFTSMDELAHTTIDEKIVSSLLPSIKRMTTSPKGKTKSAEVLFRKSPPRTKRNKITDVPSVPRSDQTVEAAVKETRRTKEIRRTEVRNIDERSPIPVIHIDLPTLIPAMHRIRNGAHITSSGLELNPAIRSARRGIDNNTGEFGISGGMVSYHPSLIEARVTKPSMAKRSQKPARINFPMTLPLRATQGFQPDGVTTPVTSERNGLNPSRRRETSPLPQSTIRTFSSPKKSAVGGPGILVAENRSAIQTAPTIVVEKHIGRAKVRAHYIQIDGKYHFAGVEDSTNRRNAIHPDAGTRALWAPTQLRDDPIGVFGMGPQSAGESALRSPFFEPEETPVEEKLAQLILEQLKMGPEKLDDHRMWETFNTFLFTNKHSHVTGFLSRDDWKAYLRMSLSLAVHHTPAMDGSGLRTVEAIRSDAAEVLSLDEHQINSWERHFGMEMVSQHLFGERTFDHKTSLSREMREYLYSGLDRQVGLLAKEAVQLAEVDFSISRDQEIKLQWMVARASFLKDPEEKIESATSIVQSLMKSNENEAARFLALIVMNSSINPQRSTPGSLAPRWNKNQVGSLIKQLMAGETWHIVSHRAFRQYLNGENKIINQMIYAANYDSRIEELRNMDVDDMALEEIPDELLDEAWHRMVENHGLN